MKPIIIVAEGVMQQAAIDALNANDICVVECKDPSLVKFVDPIPAASSRDEIENAAIKLSRILLSGPWPWNADHITRVDVCKLYVKVLAEGTALDRNSDAEQERLAAIRKGEKEAEAARLGREDARREREAKKAAKAKPPEAKA